MKSITQIKAEMALENAGETPLPRIISNLEAAVKDALWKDPDCKSIEVIVSQERSKPFVDEITKAYYNPSFKNSFYNVETGKVAVLYEVSWDNSDKPMPR